MAMTECTVCLLLTPDHNEVLLMKKDRTDYIGRYNGIGGKIETGESAVGGAIREVLEETGADIKESIRLLGCNWVPYDHAKHSAEGCKVYFYTADVTKDSVSQQEGEAEQLRWFPVEEVLYCPIPFKMFAGCGDIQSHLYHALHGYV